jgi:hypothetical protein
VDFLKVGSQALNVAANPVGFVSQFASGIPIVGGIFKSPTPRTYGRLPGTLIELQNGIEGRMAHLNNTTYDDLATVRLIDRERKTDSGMQGIWDNLVPTWNATPAARALIAQLGGTIKSPTPIGVAGTLSPMGYGAAGKVVSGVVASYTATSQPPEREVASSSWMFYGLAALAVFAVLRGRR